MKNITVNILLLILFQSSALAVQAKEAEICFVANAGFYAQDGEKGILLDALFADGLKGYHIASAPVRTELENASGKFKNVRMIFVSHFHDDHMKGEPIIKHIRANPDVKAIMPEQAKEKVIDAGVSADETQSVLGNTLKIGTQHQLLDMPFPTTLYGISHGEGRSIENIGIMVEVAGQTIMHVGDMDAKAEDLKKAGIDGLKVDWLLMPSWYLDNKNNANFIASAFDARNIIPMHFVLDDNDWIKSQGGMVRYKEKVYHSLPNITKLETEMSCLPLNN